MEHIGDRLVKENGLSAAMAAVDATANSNSNENAYLRPLIHPDQSTIARAKQVSDNNFKLIAECEERERSLSDAKESRVAEIQAVLDQQQQRIDESVTSLEARKAEIDVRLATCHQLKRKTISDASDAFDATDIAFDTEKTAIDKIRGQAVAAIIADNPNNHKDIGDAS